MDGFFEVCGWCGKGGSLAQDERDTPCERIMEADGGAIKPGRKRQREGEKFKELFSDPEDRNPGGLGPRRFGSQVFFASSCKEAVYFQGVEELLNVKVTFP